MLRQQGLRRPDHVIHLLRKHAADAVEQQAATAHLGELGQGGIAKANEQGHGVQLFEGDQLTDADAIAVFNHVADKMTENEALKEQATANTEQQFGASPDYKKVMNDAYIACFENHQSIIQQLLTNDRVKDQFAELLLPHVYGKLSRTQQPSAER